MSAAQAHREITKDDAQPMTVVDAIVEVVTDVVHILRDEMRHGHILLHLADALEPAPAPTPQGGDAPQKEEKRTAVWRMVAQGLRNVASAVGEEETTVGKALRAAARVLAPMAVAAPFVAIAGLPILAVIVISAILDRVWYGSASASIPAVRSSFFRPVIAMWTHPFLWVLRALYSSDSVVVRTLLWYRNELTQLLSLSRRVVVTHAGAGAGAGAGAAAAAGGLRDNWPNLVAALRRNFGVLQHAIEGGERRFGEALRLFRGFQRTAFLRHVSLDVAYDFYRATPFLGTWWLDTRHEWSALPAFAPAELWGWGACTTMAEVQAWAKRLLADVSQYLAKCLAPAVDRGGRAKQDLHLAAFAYLVSYDIYAWNTVRFPATRKAFEKAVDDHILTPWMRKHGAQTLRDAVRNDATHTLAENGRVASWKAVFVLFGAVEAQLAQR